MENNYEINIGNQLAQVKYCTTEEEIEQFCIYHNLEADYCLIYPENHFMRVDAYYEDKDVEVTVLIRSKEVF